MFPLAVPLLIIDQQINLNLQRTVRACTNSLWYPWPSVLLTLTVIEWMICGPFHQYSLGMLLTLKLQYKGRGWKEHYFGHVLVPLYSSWICWHIYMESLMRAWWNVQWPLTFKQFTTTRKQKHVGSLKIRNTLILKKTSFITKQNFMHSKTIMKPLCQNVKEKCEICYYM